MNISSAKTRCKTYILRFVCAYNQIGNKIKVSTTRATVEIAFCFVFPDIQQTNLLFRIK